MAANVAINNCLESAGLGPKKPMHKKTALHEDGFYIIVFRI